VDSGEAPSPFPSCGEGSSARAWLLEVPGTLAMLLATGSTDWNCPSREVAIGGRVDQTSQRNETFYTCRAAALSNADFSLLILWYRDDNTVSSFELQPVSFVLVRFNEFVRTISSFRSGVHLATNVVEINSSNKPHYALQWDKIRRCHRHRDTKHKSLGFFATSRISTDLFISIKRRFSNLWFLTSPSL
jgi:hypothetical protein